MSTDPGPLPRRGGKLTAIFKPLGFHYVTLDLEGYRQGALNEVLPDAPKVAPE